VVDLDVLTRRLDALLGYLQALEPFVKVSRDDFIAQMDTHHLAERYLHLATESMLDSAK
jgi:hypothetical protein